MMKKKLKRVNNIKFFSIVKIFFLFLKQKMMEKNSMNKEIWMLKIITLNKIKKAPEIEPKICEKLNDTIFFFFMNLFKKN